MKKNTKTIRIIKHDAARIKAWQKFMKIFKFYSPNPVPAKLMNEIMHW